MDSSSSELDRCGPGAGRDRAAEWFIVLPDDVAADPVAARLRAAPQRVEHPSGRPWLLGRWHPRDLTVGTAGHTRVAVLGSCHVSGEQLARVAGRITEVADATGAATGLAGDFHLLASIGGITRVQGALSGARRVFFARIGQVTVAAPRADVLAPLINAAIDERLLALRLLLVTGPLPALNGEPLWRGVSAVPEDSYLAIGRAGHRVQRWWSPPEPDVHLEAGAAAVREALASAVAARTGLGRPFSADLSGGLDSTSLCYLAARGGREFVTFTTDTGDPRDDDPMWADRAADRLHPWIRRIVAAADELPLHYEDLMESGPALDEPFRGVGNTAAYRAIVRLMRSTGSELHITGNGGDEVIAQDETYLPELLRRRPLTALAHLHSHRALGRWSWRATARAIRPRSARAVLASAAGRLTEGLPAGQDPAAPAHVPAWVTRDAAAVIREHLERSAEAATASSRSTAQDQAVRDMVHSGRVSRVDNQFCSALGLPMTTPFLDDRVLDACLAVRPEERSTPWQYKPLLTAAMRDIVPDISLSRTTKTDGSTLIYRAIRRHRDQLIALCEDPALANLGLIDVERLRATLSTTLWGSDYVSDALDQTLSCERWLRDSARPSGESLTALDVKVWR